MHKALIGTEWQQAIDNVDAFVMPYATERYRYHTSAMLSTAIGFHRPVIIADNVNPEVLTEYTIGLSFKNANMQDFRQKMEAFINHYDKKGQEYHKGLTQANLDFSPSLLAENLVEIAKGRALK